MTGLEDRNEPGGPAGFARWIRLRPFAMGCRLGPCTAAAVLIEFNTLWTGKLAAVLHRPPVRGRNRITGREVRRVRT